MYRIYFSNHGYYHERSYPSLDEAVAAGRAICFEFRVEHDRDGIVAAWSPISGLRRLS